MPISRVPTQRLSFFPKVWRSDFLSGYYFHVEKMFGKFFLERLSSMTSLGLRKIVIFGKKMKQHIDIFHFNICCRACLETLKSLKKFFAEKNFCEKNFFLSFSEKSHKWLFFQNLSKMTREGSFEREINNHNFHLRSSEVIWGQTRSYKVIFKNLTKRQYCNVLLICKFIAEAATIKSVNIL